MGSDIQAGARQIKPDSRGGPGAIHEVPPHIKSKEVKGVQSVNGVRFLSEDNDLNRKFEPPVV